MAAQTQWLIATTTVPFNLWIICFHYQEKVCNWSFSRSTCSNTWYFSLLAKLFMHNFIAMLVAHLNTVKLINYFNYFAFHNLPQLARRANSSKKSPFMVVWWRERSFVAPVKNGESELLSTLTLNEKSLGWKRWWCWQWVQTGREA